MGEKIRDLQKIRLGNSELLVELNEGYTKAQGHVIHLQNEFFRYLLTEKDYLRLTAEILRSKSELDYYKKNFPKCRKEEEFFSIEQVTNSNVEDFEEVVSLLQKNAIEYRIINKYRDKVTLIINNKHYDKYKSVFAKNKQMKFLQHPQGSFFGYIFLYQMRSFELFRYKSVFFEVYFQLPCMSIAPKTWVPLDLCIQESVWKDSLLKENIYYMSYTPLLIYLLCVGIFEDYGFSKDTKKLLVGLFIKIDNDILKNYVEKVFFAYSDNLMQLLIEEKYDDIIESYYTFSDY